MTLAIFLALLAGLLWAGGNVIDKTVVSKYVKNPFEILPLMGIVIFLSGFLVTIFNQNSLTTGIILRLAGLGLIIYISFIFFYFALKNEEVSRVIPFLGLAPALMALLEWLIFGTKLSSWQYGGIASVVLGALFLTWRPSAQRIHPKGIIFALFSTLFWSTGYVFLTRTFAQYGFWKSWGWTWIFLGIFCLLTLFFIRKGLWQSIKRTNNKVIYAVITGETIHTVADAIIFYAGSIWVSSLSSAVASDQYIMIFLFSILVTWKKPHWFKEIVTPKIIIQKTISILLIITGIFLISL